MDTTHWQQIEQLYNAALDLPPADRTAYLKDECGADDALCREVSSLLAAHDEEGDFLSASDFDLGLSLLAGPLTQLLPGQEFGGYTILGYIGQGGMGEVYLARDPRLGRKVALKLLPAHLTSDTAFIERFRREARAAAAVGHPQIAHVYEVGEADGWRYIAMEYVAGVTLRERLQGGAALSPVEAIRIAEQVASALAAAHDAGVVHRDIKPENIMLRPDGLVQVLDFGLAKLNEGAGLPGVEQNSALTTGRFSTEQSLIIGTVRYMSPEQARGQRVDGRTDVWSLGCVLYEMLTGVPPFGGETSSDVIAEVLKTEPAQLDDAKSSLPSAARLVLRRALKKNHSQRYQSADEMRNDLHHAAAELEARGGDAGAPAHLPMDAAAQRTAETLAFPTARLRNMSTTPAKPILIAILLVALIGFGSFLYLTMSRSGVAPDAPRPVRLTRITNSGRAVGAAISPDARLVAYALEEAGRQGIYVREVETGATRQLVAPVSTNDFAGVGMAFSIDGNALYYGVYENDSLDGTLYRVPVAGGAPARLLKGIDSPVSFSPDGSRMVFLVVKEDEEKLVVADPDGNSARTVVRRTRPLFLSHDGHPSWSPDGKHIAFAAGTRAGKRQMHLMLFDAEGGGESNLTIEPWHEIRQVAWLAGGDGLVMTAAQEGETAEQLYRVAYPGGEVAPVTNDLYDYAGIAVARTLNSLVTIAAEDTAQIWMTDVAEGETRARQISFGKHDGQGVAWTPDGRLVYGSDAEGNFDIWSMNADGGDRRRLTHEQAFDTDPDVSPDGRYIVFSSKRAGVYNLWRMNTDGSAPVQLTNGAGEYYPQVSPDNTWVVYHRHIAGDPTAIWKVRLGGGAPVQLSTTPTTRAAVSPDNRWVASTYRETPDSSFSIGIYPLEGVGATRIFKPLAGANLFVPLRWSPDGQAVVYVVSREGIHNLWSHPIDGSPPRQLTHFASEHIYSFDFAPDGKRIALARGSRSSYVVMLTDVR